MPKSNRRRWLWPTAAVVALTGAAALFGPNLALDEAVLTALPAGAARPVADRDDENIATVDLAGHEVPVREGGLYDRYRSNPPFPVVQAERPDLDLSWFEGIAKERKEVGFTTWSPNFYYDNSSITAIYTADMASLERLIPQEVREVVRPISFAPGKGLVAITSYAYHYCDNDSYNELSISVVTTRPDQGNWGLISLMGQLNDQSLWGYVLKLPVDTELARVRAVARASSRVGGDVRLALTDGPLSSFIRSLGLEKLVRYDYQPLFQAALHTPEPL